MKTLEKRDYIHSHLHQANENFINEVYQKMRSTLEGNNPIVGYGASGEPLKKSQLIADIKEAEAQIERGEYLSIEELEQESSQW